MKFKKVVMIISILLLISFIGYSNLNGGENMDNKEVYQGPVPEGYDEDYFRKTGITQPLVT